MYNCEPNVSTFQYDGEATFSLDHTHFDDCYKDLFDQIATILEAHAQTITSLKGNINTIKDDVGALKERAESSSKGIVTTGVWVNNDCSNSGSISTALSVLALKESDLLNKFIDEINNPTDLPGDA